MKKKYIIYLLTCLLYLLSYNLNAQLFTEWTGNGNWSNGGNWNNGYGYGQLEFKGAGATNSNNDNNPASQWRLYFQNNTSYTLTGNTVNFFDNSGNNSWILSDATVDQNINFNIGFNDLGSRPSWITTRNTGDLIFNGNINVANQVTHLALANSAANGQIIVNGILSGDKNVFIGRDNSFNVQETTSVQFNGANTYNADTFIDGGSLRTSGSGTLGVDADVFISASTILFVDNNLTLASVRERGIANGGTIEILNGASLTLNGNNKGAIFQNSINGAGNLVVETTGSTEHNLYGVNGLTGTTILREGTLKLLSSLPNSDITIETGGTLIVEGSGEITVKSVNIQPGGLLQINGGQSLKIAGDLLNNGTVNLSLSSGGDLKVGGNFTQNGTLNNNGRAVFFDGAGTQTVTGISLPLSFDYVRVDKSGTALSFAEDVVVTQVNGGVGYEQTNGIVTVASGKSLTVQNGGNFDIVAGTFTLESTSTSYSSLIVNNVTNTGGSIQYNRFTNAIGSGTTGGNDLVAPPLGGQAFGDFANSNDGILAASGDLRAFAPFNNGANPGAYQNYNVVTDAATALQTGQGYRAAAGAPLLFTGAVTTGNLSVGITAPTGTFGEWNLIGNPYPSYIDIEAFLNHAASGTSNIDLMKNASGIYGYDGVATDGWDVITLANAGTRLMAPGQGFFVAADADESLEFTPAMRRTGSSDDFIPGRSAPLTYLKLKASNGQQSYKTDFYFNQNATTGFDAGYDARTWGNQSSGFILYSHLVTDNTGIPMALQALGMDDLNDVSIPLGINATSGSTLEFSILESQLPSNTLVYLEDLINNTITSINNTSYSVNLNQPVSGTGRFFLRFTTGTLGIGDDTANSLNIYHDAAAQSIVIAGQLNANTQAYLYDLQGRAVSTTALSAAQLDQRIDVSNLSSGVYVLSFDNGNTRISKKLMIR